jgi:transposase-like protein
LSAKITAEIYVALIDYENRHVAGKISYPLPSLASCSVPGRCPREKRADAAWKGWSKRQKVDQQPTNRPKKFRKWNNESMLEAIEAVRSGTMGANRAARSYGVPASTLKDRLSGRVKHGTNPGPALYLTSEEEDELATFLVQLAEMGVGKTKRKVLVIV